MGREVLPTVAMALLQVGYAGLAILAKLAIDSGMNPLVLVAYRHIFATVAMGPLAYFWERRTRPKITASILFQIFLCSVLGATVNQFLYYYGLKYSNPTIVCAVFNLLPAITFIMAVPFGLEGANIKTKAVQAKVIGTALCVGGAMLVSFYKGSLLKIKESGIHLKYLQSIMRKGDSGKQEKMFLGPLCVAGSCVSWAGWFILQAKLSRSYAAPYSSTWLMCFMASILCSVVALIADHSPSAWSLESSIRIISIIYTAVLGSAIGFCVMTWCVQRKGPLFISMFNPLLPIIVAIIGWALLDDKLYVGTAIGSVLIVVGLYAVLWGKNKEMNQLSKVDKREAGSRENA